MYPYKTKFEYCIFSYVQLYAFQYKKAGIPSFEDDCFCPLASSALPSGVCYSTFWVFLSAIRRLLFCPSPYSPTFTVLPSGVYLSAIQRILLSPPMSAILFFGVCHPYPTLAIPPFGLLSHLSSFAILPSGICYSACFSPFVVIRSKIPPPTPMPDRQKDVFLTQSNHKKSKRSKTACFLLL